MVNLFTNVYIYLGTRWHNHTGSVTEFWKYARLLNMVSVTCIISIPAHLFKRGGHFVERFLQFCHSQYTNWRQLVTPLGTCGGYLRGVRNPLR